MNRNLYKMNTKSTFPIHFSPKSKTQIFVIPIVTTFFHANHMCTHVSATDARRSWYNSSSMEAGQYRQHWRQIHCQKWIGLIFTLSISMKTPWIVWWPPLFRIIRAVSASDASIWTPNHRCLPQKRKGELQHQWYMLDQNFYQSLLENESEWPKMNRNLIKWIGIWWNE